jgi:hypothetical protein
MWRCGKVEMWRCGKGEMWRCGKGDKWGYKIMLLSQESFPDFSHISVTAIALTRQNKKNENQK